MTKAEKTKIIDSLSLQLDAASNFYLTDIANLTVETTSELRRLCFKKEVQLKVVKNTLLHKAMERSNKDLAALYSTLSGSTSIMFTETGSVPAKLIQEFRKKFKSEKPILKGAYVSESTYIGEDQLEVLATIKTKNEVIAEIITLLQSPTNNVIGALQSGGHKLSGILKTLSEKEA
jgi:large subunit ribosomal protein L10